MAINLKLLKTVYCVAKLTASSDIPLSVSQSENFYSFSKSSEETSVLCAQALISADIVTDRDWRLLEFKGSMDDHLVGVVAAITQPLANQSISVIATTTYDTGYFGVKSHDLEKAISILQVESCNVTR